MENARPRSKRVRRSVICHLQSRGVCFLGLAPAVFAAYIHGLFL
jgi:hypothetical protein